MAAVEKPEDGKRGRDPEPPDLDKEDVEDVLLKREI